MKSAPWVRYIARYQGTAIAKNSIAPENNFMFFNSRQEFSVSKKRKIIKPGSKNPIGPLVKVAKAQKI